MNDSDKVENKLDGGGKSERVKRKEWVGMVVVRLGVPRKKRVG